MNSFHQAIATYRECTRHLRNAYFQPSDSVGAEWAVIEGWEEVDRMLFNWLVLYPHGLQPVDHGQSHPSIIVRIRGAGTTACINRDKLKTSGYWDHPTTALLPDDCRMTFREFFDFDQLSPIDLTYVMVELRDAKDDDLNGRFALIEWQHIEFEKK
jgi:hypothetical protein